MLKCSVCIGDLKDAVTLKCGHLYCSKCIDSHLNAHAHNLPAPCPTCRTGFTPVDVIKLYIQQPDGPSQNLVPAHPLSDNQRQEAMALVQRFDGLGIESEYLQLAEAVSRGERWMLDIEESHGETDVKDVIERVEQALISLRARLKYHARLSSAKGHHIALQSQFDELQNTMNQVLAEHEKLRADKVRSEERTREVARHIKIFEERERKWTERNKKFKERSTLKDEQHAKEKTKLQSALSNANIQLGEAQEELNKQTQKTTRYKKRYIAAKQELAELSRNRELSPTLSDSSLEIETMSSGAEEELVKDVIDDTTPVAGNKRKFSLDEMDELKQAEEEFVLENYSKRQRRVREEGVKEGWFPTDWTSKLLQSAGSSSHRRKGSGVAGPSRLR